MRCGGLAGDREDPTSLWMNQESNDQFPQRPYNPGLRRLIEGKRRSTEMTGEEIQSGFRGWHERGYLPHRDQPGLMQFVTFRLIDSFPSSLRSEWEHLLQSGDVDLRRERLEAYLDIGRGECHLRRRDIAQCVEDALRFFHGQRYELRAWVVMPNHVHVLIRVGAVPLTATVAAWKKHTARRANRILGRRGGFWQLDYWDTYMRDDGHESRTVRYIEDNPLKIAGIREPRAWPWSSARFRDCAGVLNL